LLHTFFSLNRLATTMKVAVIGGGPGGMFFCHAIESRRRLLIEAGDAAAAKLLPLVTCFEKSSAAGGVWKAATSKDTTPNMYAGLWTNGPSHCHEFYDYTFDEHFGHPVTVHMPRQQLLDYMLARVTTKCPNFFEKYFQFQKEVQHVVFDEEEQKFHVRVRDVETGDIFTDLVDKCVWACGDNGITEIPPEVMRVFKTGGFTGRMIHSAETENFEEDVRGKRVLLIGGSYSAEDLALQAIKLGVEKVYISTRDPHSAVTRIGTWPMDKVQILEGQAPVAVADSGRSIQFKMTEWTWPNKYEFYGGVETELNGIDTVVFCTGYGMNFSMLDASLQTWLPMKSQKHKLQVPRDWMMKPNVLSGLVGDVKPGDVRYYPGTVHPHLYRGVLIENPNMMFLTIYGSESPLLATDVYTWLLAGYVTEAVALPTADEMRQENREQAISEMSLPYLRYHMDKNYYKALENLPDFWEDDGYDEGGLWEQVEQEFDLYSFKILARTADEGKYPMCLGSITDLSKVGRELYDYDLKDDEHRFRSVPDENEWRTFRDYDDEDACYYRSLFTGTGAIPLKQRWIDLHDIDSWRDV
jgi:Flavin-binding monooxygenase-like